MVSIVTDGTAVKVIVEWIKASGNRAHENTVGAYPPRGVARADDSGRQRLTGSVATPDIASVDTRGQPTVYDVVITGVRAKDRFRGSAARNAEIKKYKHYDSHKQACREAGCVRRLHGNDTACHRDVRHSGGGITGIRKGTEKVF